MAIKHEGYSSWEAHWTLKEMMKSSRTRLITSIQKERSARWGYERSSRLSNGILIRGITNLKRKQVFHQELQLMEFMG